MKYFIYLVAVTFIGNTAGADFQHEENDDGTVSCSFCRLVMNTIEDNRGQQPSKANTEDAVKNVCDTLPLLFKTDCHSLIDQHEDEIIELLNNHVPTEEICLLIRLCPTIQDTEEAREGITENIHLNPICTACQTAIKEIYKQIGQDKSLKKIKYAVQHVCRIIPRIFQDKCKNTIDKYSDQVVKLILKAAKPTVICHAIHAC